jgi:hypothetical protein
VGTLRGGQLKEKIRPPSPINFPGLTEIGYRFLQELCNQINTTYGFRHRTETAAYDWVLATLTTDGNPQELDFSTIKSMFGAYAVVLSVSVRDADATGSELIIRPRAWDSNYNVFKIKTQTANVANHGTAVVMLNKNLKAEYVADNVTWDAINIAVVGWFV